MGRKEKDVKKRGDTVTKIDHVRKLLETFFEDKTESNVKEMKKHVDEKMGESINDNMFYTIINKLKKSGILMACEERGVYKWNADKAAEYMDNRRDDFHFLKSCLQKNTNMVE